MRRIKHILSLAALLLCSISVSAEDFSVGGIYYSITSEEEQTVKVTYQGSYYDSYKDEYSGAVTIPATVTYNGTTYQVAEIGKSAFHSCSSLTDIIIPEGVTSIGSNAFSKCGELSHITIPSSVTSIGNFCFSSCYNLKSVVFEDGDETLLLGNCKYSDGIGGGLFEDLRISDVYVGRNLKFSDNNDSYYRPYTNAFFAYWWATSYPIVSTVTIGPRVTELPNYMFQDCKDLTVITCMAEKVPTCYSSSFKTVRKDEGVDLGKCILYVPAGSVDAYKAAEYWKEFTNIQPIGTCGDNLTWRLTEDGELIIEGTGAMYDFSSDSAPWYEYRKSIKTVTMKKGITSIGECAFHSCSNLTRIDVPEGVVAIEGYAMCTCNSLTLITLPSSLIEIDATAFNLSGNIIQFIIDEDNPVYTDYINNAIVEKDSKTLIAGTVYGGVPDSYGYKIEHIGDYAFCGRNIVGNFSIPDGVVSIGRYAFAASTISSIRIPKTLKKCEDGAFQYSFAGYKSDITRVYIDDLSSWLDIDFYGWESNPLCNGASLYLKDELLSSIVIPVGVTTIKRCAFAGWSGKEVLFPESVTSIGDDAFYGCSGLTTITLPEGVTSIGSSAFSGCSGLTSISIPASVTSIGSSAFSGCSSLTSVTIPTSVTSIGNGVFSGCSSLTSITLPANVISIGNYAFYNCSSLVSITIPEGVTSIESYAFYNCSSLTAITIPESVTSIESYAFYGCSSLTSITCEAITPPMIESTTFQNIDKTIPLYVPAASVAIYKSAQYWNEFTNILPLPITITINQYGSGTYSSPYALDFSNVKVLRAYVATGYNHITGEVTLLRVHTAEAGTGLLVKGTPGVTYEVPVIESTADHTLNLLVATLEKTRVDKYSSDGMYANYKYTVIKSESPEPLFYPFADGSSLSAGKAYLQLPKAWLPEKENFVIRYRFDEGETTGFDDEQVTIDNQSSLAEGESNMQLMIYDLMGRRVLSPKKGGIYIINGRKVVY